MENKNTNNLSSKALVAILSGIALSFISFIVSIIAGEVLNGGKDQYTYYIYILSGISVLCGTVLSCTILIIEQLKSTHIHR